MTAATARRAALTEQLASQVLARDAVVARVVRDAPAQIASLRSQIRVLTAPPAARVLVVEDDEDSGEMLRAGLEQAFAATGRAAEVRVVADAADAIDAASHEAWAVVVIDLHLGHHRLSGLDVIRALSPWTPFILVSGTVPESLPALAQRSRAAAHFEKPYDVERVAACVAALLDAPAAAPR